MQTILAEQMSAVREKINANFTEAYSPGNTPPYPVSSVNSKTGTVVLNPSDIGAASYVNYTGTISTTWTGSSAPYSQEITISGLMATDKPIMDMIPSSDPATAKTEGENFAKVYKATASVNTLTLLASKATTVAISIQLQVVR